MLRFLQTLMQRQILRQAEAEDGKTAGSCRV